MTARRARRPRVVAVSGRSGAGKTRLLARLIPALARRGVACAVVKHTRHPHAFDRPGKDTDVLRRAGAVAAAIAGPAGLAWFGPAPAGRDGLAALVALMPPVSLVLAEGFRDAPVARIEVHRRRISREFLCADDPRVFAVVTDEPPPRELPAFGADDVEGLADLVCARLSLGRTPGRRGRLRPRPRVLTLPRESGRTVAPRERGRMAKTTSRKGGSRRGRRSGTRRSGSAGGRATLRSRGPEFYAEIGRKGGKRSAAARRGSASSRGRGKASGGRRRPASRRRSRSSR
ncbi:MAG TPA: molybdopterin-guanine dinucleotide biosynthesis protein B [Anaeromyxobacter sp.]|nr:molybdopterin-guanine dinucleotide biosynthesis protein B [Anaeromyxobacter sp.]